MLNLQASFREYSYPNNYSSSIANDCSHFTNLFRTEEKQRPFLWGKPFPSICIYSRSGWGFYSKAVGRKQSPKFMQHQFSTASCQVHSDIWDKTDISWNQQQKVCMKIHSYSLLGTLSILQLKIYWWEKLSKAALWRTTESSWSCLGISWLGRIKE